MVIMNTSINRKGYRTLLLVFGNWEPRKNRCRYPCVPVTTSGTLLPVLGIKVETKMHFYIFATMRISCENGLIFAKFHEFCAIFFVFEEIFAKTKNLNKFDTSRSDTECMVHAVSFIYITLNFGLKD
jgi:hypothetical protein